MNKDINPREMLPLDDARLCCGNISLPHEREIVSWFVPPAIFIGWSS